MDMGEETAGKCKINCLLRGRRCRVVRDQQGRGRQRCQFVVRRTGLAAEDAAQATFIVAMNRRTRYRQPQGMAR